MSLLTQLTSTFAVLSLLSVGGANATIPEIQRQVVLLHHWMDDATFVNLVAIGQTAPGPNVLIVSIIGWHLAGYAGLFATSAAIVLPSSTLAFGVGRVMSRFQAHEGIAATRRAVTPIAIGLMFASAIVMARSAYQGPLTLAIVIVATAVVYGSRLSPLWSILGGALCGIVAHRLHAFG